MLLKYNGEQENYIANGTDDDGNSLFTKATTDAYSWLDASVIKSFFDNTIDLTIGSRNLLDITNVNVSNASSVGDVHTSNNSALLLGYGRSYYLKLLYNLNF
jgi:outer membrane receptor for ferrienterochelin and colicins